LAEFNDVRNAGSVGGDVLVDLADDGDRNQAKDEYVEGV
jgi:hypothetical protein